MLNRAIDELNDIFKDLSINRGKNHNYLGMVLNFDSANKSVNIVNNYTNKIMTYSNIDGVTATPANKGLFTVKTDSKP